MFGIGFPYGMYGGANLYPEFDDVSDPYNVLPPSFGSFPTNNVCGYDSFTTGNGLVRNHVSFNSSVHEKSDALPLALSLLAGGLIALGLLHGGKGAKAAKKVVKEVEEAVGAETTEKVKKPNIFKRIWGKIFPKKNKTKIDISDDYKDVWDAENAYLKPRDDIQENANAVRKLVSNSETKVASQPVSSIKNNEEELRKNANIYNSQAETACFRPGKDKYLERSLTEACENLRDFPETNSFGLPINKSLA